MKKKKPRKNQKVSDQQFLEVWEKISKKLGYKFKFGYHTHEDMKQQAAIFALEGLKNYDHERPLENFLWTHVRNRLFNYKRDNYQRPDKPCLTCPFFNKANSSCSEFSNQNDCELYASWSKRNDAKKNIMKPIGMDSLSETTKELVSSSLLDSIGNNEILNIINKNISVKNRHIFLKLQGGNKVPKSELKKLISEIQNILKDHDIQL
jgi:hypothetical protein